MKQSNDKKIDIIQSVKIDRSTNRLASLDVLRGFNMFFLIGGREIIITAAAFFGPSITALCNEQLHHVRWEGFVFWDLIMPLFLFMVGTSMSFSLRHRIASSESLAPVYTHIFKRVLILYILGLIIAGRIHLMEWERVIFFDNTLQTIAIGYLFASICMLHFNIRGQILFFIGLLLSYWAILSFVPGPDFPAGTLTEKVNIALVIDKRIFGIHRLNSSYSWVLSCLTFTASVLSGVFAGHWLQTNVSQQKKITVLFISGIGLLLSGWFWGEYNLPIIKHIWTSSMVLFAAGWSVLLLTFFFIIVDVWQIRKPFHLFRVIGLNSIFAYVIWNIFGTRIFPRLFSSFFEWIFNSVEIWVLFMTAICSFSLFWFILYLLYKNKYFVKI